MPPDGHGYSEAANVSDGTLLRIKADRDPLDCPNIIHRTFLFKIGQSDMAVFLVDPDGRDRRRDFLDQCQPFLSVLFHLSC